MLPCVGKKTNSRGFMFRFFYAFVLVTLIGVSFVHAQTDPQNAEQEMRALYHQVLPIVHGAKTEPSIIEQAFRAVQNYNIKFNSVPDSVQAKLTAQKTTLNIESLEMFEMATIKAENGCRSHDLTSIKRLLYYAKLRIEYPLVGIGMPSHVEVVDKAMACAHFDINFRSKMVEVETDKPKRATVEGVIHIEPMLMSDTAIGFTGKGAIRYTTAIWPSDGCPTEVVGKPGEIGITDIDLGLGVGPDGPRRPLPPNTPVTEVQIDLLMPRVMEEVTIKCPGAPPFSFPGAFWFTGWFSAHEDEYNEHTGNFVLKQWVLDSSGTGVLATKNYRQRADGMGKVQEESRLKLIHTPKL